MSLATGSEQRIAHYCYEHSDQASDSLRVLGQPAPTIDQGEEGAATMELSSRPVHVDSTDDELVARVAAIDVAKDSGMVCAGVLDEARPGLRSTTVWSVRARTTSIIALTDQLVAQRIERVVLEATSVAGDRSTTCSKRPA